MINPINKEILDRLAAVTTWISAEEENRLILRYQTDQDREALEALFYSFGRRLLSILHEFRRKFVELKEVPVEDMVGPAIIGLAYAVNKFDVTRKTRLISFSYFAILNAVRVNTLSDGTRHEIEDIENCAELSYFPDLNKVPDLELVEDAFNLSYYPKMVTQYELVKRVRVLLDLVKQTLNTLDAEKLYQTWEYEELFGFNQYFPIIPDHSKCKILDDLALLVYTIEMFNTCKNSTSEVENMLRSLILNKSSDIVLIITKIQDDIILEKVMEVALGLLDSNVPLMVYNIKYRRPLILPINRFYRKMLELSNQSKTVVNNLGSSKELTEMGNIEGRFLCIYT